MLYYMCFIVTVLLCYIVTELLFVTQVAEILIEVMGHNTV